MNGKQKRALVIGLDGASMQMLRHMVDLGVMPNVSRLMQDGVSRPMVGVHPTLTPPGWTSLYTGSWIPTHGVTDFFVHLPGHRLPDTAWGVNTGLSRAEYVWNTAERSGKIPLLIKVETSWPPTIKTGVQIEGTGPGVSNYHQISGYHLFVAGKWAPRFVGREIDPATVDPSYLQDGSPMDPVAIQPVDQGRWKHLPSSTLPHLEVQLTLRPLKRGDPSLLRGREGTPKTLFGLVYGRSADSYDRLRICRDRDASESVGELSAGEWTDWWQETFEIDGASTEGHVRAKLLTLTPTADSFELFVPQIWPSEGYTYPAEIALEVERNVGPFLQNPGRDALGLIDDDTYFELLEYHHSWLARAARYLTSTRPWGILFIETHASDYANHAFLTQADERCGADAQTLKRCHDGLTRTYASIDNWIGQLLEAVGDQCVVTIASDHGGTPTLFPRIDPNEVLARAGLLAYHEGNLESSQEPKVSTVGMDRADAGSNSNPFGRIDFARTKAANIGQISVFVNLKGREPDGIVEPDDYEEVQRQVIDALLTSRDPSTRRRQFALALTREQAEVLNLSSDRLGDVIFALYPEFDAAHGKQLPAGKFGIGGQHSAFVMAGPGVRKGVELDGTVRVVDVIPTLCHLLGMPMPRNAEGRVIREALDAQELPDER